MRMISPLWFAPLVETSSPLLQNFPTFLAEFEATFGDTGRRRSSITKLYSLHQYMRPVSVYASEFRQLACDVQWDGQALCDHFHRGLRSEIKNLLLNFPESTSSSQAIAQVVSCGNRLFELCQEERATSRWKPSSRSPPSSWYDDPVPMEIDQACALPLIEGERRYRRTNGLCLYCSASTHLICFCPIKNNERQISTNNTTRRPQQREYEDV